MGKSHQIIQSNFTLEDEQLRGFPEKEIEDIVKKNLAYTIANFILDNFDNLPAKFEVEHDNIVRGRTYKLSFILVDEGYLKDKEE